MVKPLEAHYKLGQKLIHLYVSHPHKRSFQPQSTFPPPPTPITTSPQLQPKPPKKPTANLKPAPAQKKTQLRHHPPAHAGAPAALRQVPGAAAPEQARHPRLPLPRVRRARAGGAQLDQAAAGAAGQARRAAAQAPPLVPPPEHQVHDRRDGRRVRVAGDGGSERVCVPSSLFKGFFSDGVLTLLGIGLDMRRSCLMLPTGWMSRGSRGRGPETRRCGRQIERGLQIWRRGCWTGRSSGKRRARGASV